MGKTTDDFFKRAMEKDKSCKDVFEVTNEKGLHTRPCSEIVKCATSFKSQVVLHYQDITVNAKSILEMLMLAAIPGAKIVVEAVGEDAEEAVKSIMALASNRFNVKY